MLNGRFWKDFCRNEKNPQKSGKWKGGLFCEGKIISKTYLRKMQSHQEKGKHQNYLRKPEA